MNKNKLEQETNFLQQQVNQNLGEMGILAYNFLNTAIQLRDKTLSKIIRLNQLKAKLDVKMKREQPKPLKEKETEPKK